MALGPIDYVSGLLPTNDSIVQGLGQGMQLRAAYDQQQLLKQQQAAALAAQQKYEQDKAAALANPTPQAFAALAVNYPQHREAFKQGWDQLNTAQQQGELRDTSTIAAALQSGRPDVALSKIDERIAAMKTGGQDTSALTFLRDRIQQDPRKAHGDVLNVLAGLPGGDKVLENLGKIGTEARSDKIFPSQLAKAEAEAETAKSTAQKTAVDAKYAEQKANAEIAQMGAQLGLTNAQIKQAQALTNKYGAETQKTLLEVAQAGKPSQAQMFDAEAKLRGEYNKATAGFTDVTESYRRLKASNNDAAGDLSLIFSYMKMLDPGSVVREGEFATAQNAAGVPDRITNVYNRLISGERLTEGQRKQFMQQAGSLFSAAEKREKEVRAGIGKVAKSYGLNADNIFSSRIEEDQKDFRPPLPSGAPPDEPGASIRPPAPAPAGRPPLSSFNRSSS